ncbi:hypothetical protein ACOJQX_08260 [Escherichia coli]
MAEKLSTWKFILIWLVFVIMASGYFIGQIRWWALLNKSDFG